jgi:hypothetical protein
MRANEFIVERKGGKMTKRQQNPTRGVNKYTDADRWNSDYKLYRLGLALAGTDGKDIQDMDEESWIGRYKSLHPYSEKEQDMIDLAAKVAGVNILDVNHGDMRSMETDDTYTTSPVANWNKRK